MNVKKILSSLLIAACCSHGAYAVTYSHKTFLMPRTSGANLAMQNTGWHHLAAKPEKGDKTAIGVTGMFQRSVNGEALGKYFGVGNNLDTFRVSGAHDANVSNEMIFHHHAGIPAGDFQGTVKLNPVASSYGLNLSFWKDFSGDLKNFFFTLQAPVMHVEHDMNLEVINGKDVTFAGKTFGIKDFFAGNIKYSAAEAPEDIQGPLKKLKVDGRRSVGGVADLDLALGYRLHQSATKYLHAAAHILVPTGNKVTGEYLFEPVCGNGHHLAFGASIHGGAQVWKGSIASFSFNLGAQYRYLCQGSQVRIPTNSQNDDIEFFTHYHLGLKRPSTNLAQVTLEPIANLLPQNVRVKPGSQFETHLGLCFEGKGFVLDMGYNMFWKDQESVWLKDKVDRVGIALNAAQTTADDASANGFYDFMVLDEHLNVDTIKTPTQVTHKLFAALSHKFYISNAYPVLATFGGSYELVQDNAALEQYAVWAKCGIAF